MEGENTYAFRLYRAVRLVMLVKLIAVYQTPAGRAIRIVRATSF